MRQFPRNALRKTPVASLCEGINRTAKRLNCNSIVVDVNNLPPPILLIARARRRRKVIHVSFACAIPHCIYFMLLHN